MAEPVAALDLPAVVLSLEQAMRPSVGLGDQGATIRNGALAWSAQIDLAEPYLPDDPAHTFSLVSGDRLQLTLPHGGLVHQDGADTLPGPDDGDRGGTPGRWCRDWQPPGPAGPLTGILTSPPRCRFRTRRHLLPGAVERRSG
jgi:hypothetical protein